MLHFIFSKMEQDRILNVGDDLDIYSLHFVLLPMLRKAISSFIFGWNNHKVTIKRFIRDLQQLRKGEGVSNSWPSILKV